MTNIIKLDSIVFERSKIKIDTNINLKFNDSILYIPKPGWLLNDNFYDPVWIIQDGIRSEYIVKINFDTIMPDYRNLLEHTSLIDTIKLCIILSRNGNSKTHFADKGDTQKQFATNLIIIAKWLINNRLEKFSDLTDSHITRLKKEWLYGTSELLQYNKRYLNKIQEYRDLGITLPVKRNGKRKPALDNQKICRDAGFSLNSWQRTKDKAGHHLRLQIAMQENLYIKPKYKNIKVIDDTNKPVISKASTLRTSYLSIEKLWQMSSITKKYNLDFLNVRPFPNISYEKEAKTVGIVKEHTKTIPEPVALDFIDSCIHWVVDYGHELLDIRDQVVQKYHEDRLIYSESGKTPARQAAMTLANYIPKNRGKAEPWPIIGFIKNNFKSNKFKNEKRLKPDHNMYNKIHEIVTLNGEKNKQKQYSLHTLVNGFLPLACVIVILAFTARRKIEVELIREQCVFKKNDKLWINMYSAKGDYCYVDFPTVRIVEMAVKLLERWSLDARKISGKKLLLQKQTFNTKEVSKWNWHDYIDDFTEFVNVIKDSENNKWDFSEHQFRRFFCMMFFWRYDYSDLQALSSHLRHEKLEMTFDYITETVAGSPFHEEMRRRIKKYFDLIHQGNSDLVGPMSRNIAEKVTNIMKTVAKLTHTGREGSFEKWLEKHLDDVGYVLNFKPWGLCFGKTPSREKLSACFINGYLNFNDAESEQCKHCANFATHRQLLKKSYGKPKQQPEENSSTCESPLFQAILENNWTCDNEV